MTKAISLYLVTLMPTLSAAIRLSRMAMIARPVRLRTRFSTTTRVIITSAKPIAKVAMRGVARGALGALDDFDAVFAEAERGHALGAVHVQGDVQAVLIPAHQKAVDQILDDLAEGQGDNGQVVPPEPQHRNPDDEAHDGGKEGAHHQGDDHPHQIIWDSRSAGSWRQ